MEIITIIGGLILGSLFGYVLAKIKNIEDALKLFNERYYSDWYDLCMKDGELSNHIEYLETFLKMKYPDMDKEMMEKYAHMDKNE